MHGNWRQPGGDPQALRPTGEQLLYRRARPMLWWRPLGSRGFKPLIKRKLKWTSRLWYCGLLELLQLRCSELEGDRRPRARHFHGRCRLRGPVSGYPWRRVPTNLAQPLRIWSCRDT